MRTWTRTILELLVLIIAIAFITSQHANAGSDTIRASSATTDTYTSSDIVKDAKARGAHFIFVVSAVTGGSSITPKIQGKDKLDNYYDILVGSAITSTGTTVLKIYPGIGVIANGSAADLLPQVYRVIVTNTGGGSYTYSVTQYSGE